MRTETCPSGLKTGDPITPSEGYIGGLQTIAPIAIDPAGNAWVGNGFNDTETGFSKAPLEARSTQFGAHTIVVFFGVAKPVKTPLIGPVRDLVEPVTKNQFCRDSLMEISMNNTLS
ncbi:MAG: hypothetical protein HC808_16405, partial [Candidatus Competibacteraceae bacterium]|nr:hypothetical protein [Candidatus Competibacteraceae bacterium]